MKLFLSISVIGLTACYNVYQLGNYVYQEYNRRYKPEKKMEKSDETEEISTAGDSMSITSKDHPNTFDSTTSKICSSSVFHQEQILTTQDSDQHGDAITTKNIMNMADSTYKQQPSDHYPELMTTVQNNDMQDDMILKEMTITSDFTQQSSSVSNQENIIK